MPTKIIKLQLEHQGLKSNALAFMPDPSGEIKSSLALLTHGYTSHKGSILNWASRLSDEGIPTLLFDQPGHYLGGFHEVDSFENYKNEAHKLFHCAYEKLKNLFKESYPLYEYLLEESQNKVILAGHSLGAMLALKALKEEVFSHNAFAICVGLGINVTNKTHIFQTPFYKSTLNIREQLVSPELCSNNVFPWLTEEKKNIQLQGKTIHFITGKDDLVVGERGTEEIIELLKSKNTVTFDKPNSLPHHQPDMAASFVKKFIKNQSII